MHGKRVNIIHTEIVKEKSFIYKKRLIQSPEDAVEMISYFMKNSDKEKLYVVCLDNKGEPVSLELVALGTSDAALVGMKEIYKNAILVNSNKILVFHNHTSGSTRPSKEDVNITERMEEAGRILGIQLVDHIIVGENGDYYSFCKEGRLKCGADQLIYSL